MPDSKGELRKRFEVDVVGRGLDEQEWEERAVVREHRAWLESALSTAKQRIEELEKELASETRWAKQYHDESVKAEQRIEELEKDSEDCRADLLDRGTEILALMDEVKVLRAEREKTAKLMEALLVAYQSETLKKTQPEPRWNLIRQVESFLAQKEGK